MTVCYQQREWQHAHFLGDTLPCILWGHENRTATAMLLPNDEEAIFSKFLVVGDPSAMQKEWANDVSGKPKNFGVKIKSILHDVLCHNRVFMSEYGPIPANHVCVYPKSVHGVNAITQHTSAIQSTRNIRNTTL